MSVLTYIDDMGNERSVSVPTAYVADTAMCICESGGQVLAVEVI